MAQKTHNRAYASTNAAVREIKVIKLKSWAEAYSCLFCDVQNELGFYLPLKLMKRNLHNVKRMTSHPVHQYCKCFICDPELCKWPVFLKFIYRMGNIGTL